MQQVRHRQHDTPAAPSAAQPAPTPAPKIHSSAPAIPPSLFTVRKHQRHNQSRDQQDHQEPPVGHEVVDIRLLHQRRARLRPEVRAIQLRRPQITRQHRQQRRRKQHQRRPHRPVHPPPPCIRPPLRRRKRHHQKDRKRVRRDRQRQPAPHAHRAPPRRAPPSPACQQIIANASPASSTA